MVRTLLMPDTGNATRLQSLVTAMRVPDSNVTALHTYSLCVNVKPASVRRQPGEAALDEGLLPTQPQCVAD